jgi:hypothetical protein
MGVKGGRCIRLTTLLPSVNQFSMRYWSPRPITRIVLPFPCYKTEVILLYNARTWQLLLERNRRTQSFGLRNCDAAHSCSHKGLYPWVLYTAISYLRSATGKMFGVVYVAFLQTGRHGKLYMKWRWQIHYLKVVEVLHHHVCNLQQLNLKYITTLIIYRYTKIQFPS